MAHHKNTSASIIKVLIFIMIGAVLIVFTDLFILNGNRHMSWWNTNSSTSSDAPIDLARLKTQNTRYLENGINLPDGLTAQSPTPNLLASLQRKESNTVISQTSLKRPLLNDPMSDVQIANIEPALGVEKGATIIPDTTGRENIENVILNLGHTPNDNNARSEAAEAPKHIAVTTNPTEKQSQATDSAPHQYIAPQGNGKIAIIIDDMGLTLRSKLVEVMPAPLTLSYLPYAKDLKERTKRAAANGHELMVHIPMQPLNDNIDAGPHVLKVDQTPKELLANLDWDLSRFDGFVGVNNHMGSRITGDRRSMAYVMSDLKKRGLYFIDSRTISASVAADVAKEYGLAYGERDIFLDHKITPEFIHGALKKLEDKARKNGYAIAIGHPHKETIDALKEWIPTLKDKGLTLVPASAVLHQPIESTNDILANSDAPEDSKAKPY
tara:strand:+ start:1389 stop:2705 length:1317 start_codon:yes stop_codon:yes gene_type:complete